MNRLFLFLLILLPTRVSADYWYCEYSATDKKTPVSYYSEVFGTADARVGARMDSGFPTGMDDSPATRTPGPTTSGPSRREIGDAFARFIAGSNPARGTASCDSSPTRSGAERDLQRRKDKAAKKQRAVVQSDWIYSDPM